MSFGFGFGFGAAFNLLRYGRSGGLLPKIHGPVLRSPFAVRGRFSIVNEEVCRMHRAIQIGFSLRLLSLAVVAMCAAPLAVQAQQAASMPNMSSTAEAQSAPAGGQTATGDSTAGFKAADERMMKAMEGSAYTGNADADFVSHMIAHHQGAVDMAQVELKYGKDPQLKRLANNIVESQRREIKFMKAWQEKHAKR